MQKGDLFETKNLDAVYCYFVVFNPNSEFYSDNQMLSLFI